MILQLSLRYTGAEAGHGHGTGNAGFCLFVSHNNHAPSVQARRHILPVCRMPDAKRRMRPSRVAGRLAQKTRGICWRYICPNARRKV